MIAHPTHVLRTTRGGSRRHVRWLNQPTCSGKGEPKRRKAGVGPCPPRIVVPDTKDRGIFSRVTDASLLLVILHYLLKNNIRIYEDDMCRLSCPPSASADKTKSTVGGN